MTPERVHFQSRSSPFGVRITHCGNPDCDCGEVTFHLIEEAAHGDRAGAAPMQLQIIVDTEKWEELRPAQRTQEEAAVAQEFLRDYPESERSRWQEMKRWWRQRARRLREYRIGKQTMEKNLLVSFGEVASDKGGVASGNLAGAWRVRHENEEYFVDDLYCPRPDCPCREVHLRFFEHMREGAAPDAGAMEERFVARVSLEGQVHIEERFGCSPGYADEVVAAWRSQAGRLEDLNWRYRKMKEIGRRSKGGHVVEMAGNPRTTLATGRRPGRNAPCPCGSGKKFKKCCGTADSSL